MRHLRANSDSNQCLRSIWPALQNREKTGKKTRRRNRHHASPLAGKKRKENSGAAAPGFLVDLAFSLERKGRRASPEALRRIAGRPAGPAVAGFQVSFASGGWEAKAAAAALESRSRAGQQLWRLGTTFSGEPDRFGVLPNSGFRPPQAAACGPMRCGWLAGRHLEESLGVAPQTAAKRASCQMITLPVRSL